MPYAKRQIIEVYFPIGDKVEVHPAVILSVDTIYEMEQYYICAMITGSPVRDEFSFEIKDHHINKPLFKNSQVRTHLIAQILDEDINKATPINHFNPDAFMDLIDHIDEQVFGMPFEL